MEIGSVQSIGMFFGTHHPEISSGSRKRGCEADQPVSFAEHNRIAQVRADNDHRVAYPHYIKYPLPGDPGRISSRILPCPFLVQRKRSVGGIAYPVDFSFPAACAHLAELLPHPVVTIIDVVPFAAIDRRSF